MDHDGRGHEHRGQPVKEIKASLVELWPFPVCDKPSGALGIGVDRPIEGARYRVAPKVLDKRLLPHHVVPVELGAPVDDEDRVRCVRMLRRIPPYTIPHGRQVAGKVAIVKVVLVPRAGRMQLRTVHNLGRRIERARHSARSVYTRVRALPNRLGRKPHRVGENALQVLTPPCREHRVLPGGRWIGTSLVLTRSLAVTDALDDREPSWADAKRCVRDLACDYVPSLFWKVASAGRRRWPRRWRRWASALPIVREAVPQVANRRHELVHGRLLRCSLANIGRRTPRHAMRRVE